MYFVFSVFSNFQQSAGSTLMHGLPGTHNINERHKQPGEMLKCWDKLSRSGRAGQLHRRGSWLVAVSGQRSLLLATFLRRYTCFDFCHDPQARWLRDPRILNPTEALSSFILSMVGNFAYTERVRPQLSVSMETLVSLTYSPHTHTNC